MLLFQNIIKFNKLPRQGILGEDERLQLFLKALLLREFAMQHISFRFQLEHIDYLLLSMVTEINFMDYFIGILAETKDSFKPKNLHFY